jgi:uncharacterized protein (DUF1684 family)
VTRFGTGPGVDLVLPEGSTAAEAGRFERTGGKVRVSLAEGVEATIGDVRVREQEMKADVTGAPDVLRLGRLSMHVIARGDRIGIRLKDPMSPRRQAFTGLQWFDVADDYRITARFVPYDKPRMIRVPNVLGDSASMPSPGYASFSLGGQKVRLEGVLEAPDATELFFIIRDQTSGKETYPGGRFFYSALPKDGRIVLDLNKAYSPPCAFTEYATCPLPPRQNWLPVPVRAGEKYDGH